MVNYDLTYLVLTDLQRKSYAIGKSCPDNKIIVFLTIIIFILSSNGFRSIFLYRIMHNLKDFKFAIYLISFIRWITFSVHIPHNAEIGPGFLIGHHNGIIINSKCVIGKNFTIQQESTLGGNMYKVIDNREAPFIGDNVFIGPGAKILGPVIIGNNSIIGANAVVVKDIPENSVAVGIPAKVIKKVEIPYIQIEKNSI